MTNTVTASIHDPAAGIDPRLSYRLEDTLSSRLQEFEAARCPAQQHMTEARNRIVHLEYTLGVPLAECRAACDIVLEILDRFDALKAEDSVDLDPLLEQVASITALIDELSAATATRGPLADRSAFPKIAPTSGV